jgi:hypothetical protein
MCEAQTESCEFVYSGHYFLAGLIVDDLEIEGRVCFTFTPGRSACGPTYSSGGEPADDAEIEIIKIEVFGHADEANYRAPEYRILRSTDPMWDKIEAFLLGKCFGDMCEAAEDRP